MKQIEFTVRAEIYIVMWLKNLGLTLLTFGVWSSWAKVQHRRYFSESSLLLGDSFLYRARGFQFFLGQLVVALFIVIANIASFSVLSSVLVSIFSFLLYAWASNKGWRFRTRNISWRGVRLNWYGTFLGMLGVSLLGVLAFVPFLTPIATWYYTHYVVRNLGFGQLRFKLRLPLSRWYLMSLKVFALGVIIALAVGVVLGLLSYFVFSLLGDNTFYWGGMLISSTMIISFIISFIVSFTAFIWLYSFFSYQLVLKSLSLESEQVDNSTSISFRLRLDKKYFGVLLTNAFFSSLTFLLFTPWAQLRLRRYILERLEIVGIEQLGEIFDQQQETGSAVGEELSEGLGFGVGFLWWK